MAHRGANEQRAKDLLDRALAQDRFGCSSEADGNELLQEAAQQLDSIPSWESETQMAGMGT